MGNLFVVFSTAGNKVRKAHEGRINSIIRLKSGLIISGGADGKIVVMNAILEE